ncbi:MAG: sulfatase-like hydrolase/transferase [Alphaproteobacteria bacterium]|nr:sulfatase-like hydrolase/transferase [Alphaproteobacteria bacterium]
MLLLPLLLSACATLCAPAPPPLPPNFLVVVLDDVGLDQVGAFGMGADPPALPTLDALAAEGVRFTSAYVSPVCSPTRAMLLTGRYGRRTGIGRTVDPRSARVELPADEVGLAEVLATAPVPYDSAVVGKWHLAGPRTPSGLDHPATMGFRHARTAVGNLGPESQVVARNAYRLWPRVVDGVEVMVDRDATEVQTEDAVALLGELQEPWLMWLAYNAPHAPWIDDDGKHAPVARYRAMLEGVDAGLGRVLASLDPAERARTLVVVVSDNGTPGAIVSALYEDYGAKGEVVDLATRVPWILAGAGVQARGEVSRALVHAVDLFPTLASLAGIDPEAPAEGTAWPEELDGRSFAHLLRTPDAAHRDHVYLEHFGPNGVRRQRRSDRRAVRTATHLQVRLRGARDALFAYPPDSLEPGPDLLAPEAEPDEATLRLAEELGGLIDRYTQELR